MGEHTAPAAERTWKPEKKVTASTAGGAGAAVVMWLAALVGLDLPAGVAEAVVVLAVAVAGWLAPHTPRSEAP